MKPDSTVINFQTAILVAAEKRLGRPLTVNERAFVTERQGLLSLEAIHDTVTTLSGIELERYLRSESTNMEASEINSWADAYIRAQSLRDTDAVAADPELWSAIDSFMLPLSNVHSEDCWSALVAVVRKTKDEWVLGMLAAGPLEDLLSYAGDQFIERIEIEARRDSTFCWMLHQIYESGSPEVWARIEAVRKECDST